jgi:hypothetical protein
MPDNFNDLLPAPPVGTVNVKFQADAPLRDPSARRNASAYVPAFVASGAGHKPGIVPDPGATAGTTRFLREDATFVVPPVNVNALLSTIGIVIDGGGSVPVTGAKGFIQVPYAGTITGWTMIADQSGSAQITVSKGTYSAFPTVSSIDASAPPNLSSAQKSTSTTLTGWATAINPGDVLSFNLDSVTTCQRIILELKITRS